MIGRWVAGFRVGMTTILLGSLLAGCGTAPLLKGNDAFHRGDYAAAEARWKPLAEAGNFHAQHNLAVLNKTRGDAAAAAFWWEQAVAWEFVPSMLELGALKLATGDPDAAEALYRRAARWGDKDAVAVLEAWAKPVPHADLLLAQMRLLEFRRNQVSRQLDRPGPNEFLNRKLDYYAAISEND